MGGLPFFTNQGLFLTLPQSRLHPSFWVYRAVSNLTISELLPVLIQPTASGLLQRVKR